ncbi:MAG: CCA tRNA nucleotidyltransferase [Planctomycetes bacterium]|nr:CCA tRNA nucleotidyltransferase [Planctomycetota bacterium]
MPATALARRVIRRLRELGHEALLAGGCVRDLLLGREPKDYDVATSALPDAVEAAFARTVAVGKQFGVIRVLDENLPEIAIEVATFRHDGPYLDGRHPSSVAFTSAPEDAARRDFTVNALFLDPETSEVHDYVGGLADLKRRVIRAVGIPRARFEEDKLRLLRAVRFAAGLGFDIADETLEAVTAMAPQVCQCSGERIRDELARLLTAKGASRGLRLMLQTGLLDAILPEVAAMHGVRQPPEFHPEGDVLVHTMLALDMMDQPASLTLALAVLLHDVGKPPTFDDSGDRIRFHGHDKLGAQMAGEILLRLRFPGEVIARVASLVQDHLKFINVPKMSTATLKRFLRKEHFDEDLALHRLDCQASHGKLDTWCFARDKLAEFARQPQALRPPLPLDGNDLKALGLPPGPVYRELLTALEDEVLEGRVANREQALAFVKGRAGLRG